MLNGGFHLTTHKVLLIRKWIHCWYSWPTSLLNTKKADLFLYCWVKFMSFLTTNFNVSRRLLLWTFSARRLEMGFYKIVPNSLLLQLSLVMSSEWRIAVPQCVEMHQFELMSHRNSFFKFEYDTKRHSKWNSTFLLRKPFWTIRTKNFQTFGNISMHFIFLWTWNV